MTKTKLLLGLLLLLWTFPLTAQTSKTFFKVENEKKKVTGYVVKTTEALGKNQDRDSFKDTWTSYNDEGKKFLDNIVLYSLNPATIISNQVLDLREDSSYQAELKANKITLVSNLKGAVKNYSVPWDNEAVYFDLLPYKIEEQMPPKQGWVLKAFTPLVVGATGGTVSYVPLVLKTVADQKQGADDLTVFTFEIDHFAKRLLPAKARVYSFGYNKKTNKLAYYTLSGYTYSVIDRLPIVVK